MKKGDWVFDGCDAFGKVKNKPYDSRGITHVDITIFDRSGNELGRTSPAMGGPQTFEPACTASEWTVIKTPEFPLSRYADLKDILHAKCGA